MDTDTTSQKSNRAARLAFIPICSGQFLHDEYQDQEKSQPIGSNLRTISNTKVYGKIEPPPHCPKYIALWDGKQFGRGELVRVTRSAHSRDNDQCACKKCLKMRALAKNFVPRELVRINVASHGSVLVWMKNKSYVLNGYVSTVKREQYHDGKLQIYTIKNSCENKNEINDWLGPIEFRIGDVLNFSAPEVEESEFPSRLLFELRLCCFEEAITETVSIPATTIRVHQVSSDKETPFTDNDAFDIEYSATYNTDADAVPQASNNSLNKMKRSILSNLESQDIEMQNVFSEPIGSTEVPTSRRVPKVVEHSSHYIDYKAARDKSDSSSLPTFVEIPETDSNDKYTAVIQCVSKGLKTLGPSKEDLFILFFVSAGFDMQEHHIHGNGRQMRGLKHTAIERGGIVLDTFDKHCPPWPNHFVIGENTHDEQIVSKLGFTDYNEMMDFVEMHNIVCAKKSWVDKGSAKERPPLAKAKMAELRLGFRSHAKRLRQNLQPIPSHSRQKTGDFTPNLNKELADLFFEISKQYNEAPLDKGDVMKSYMFQKIAGRLRHLDFKITNENSTLQRARDEVNGFGESMVAIVQDFFNKGTGTCTKLENLKSDKSRVAMRAMMMIWGVGASKASELVRLGYKRIGDIRHALNDGRLKLDRNQYIGVLHYEDFMLKMSRKEVECITKLVERVVHDRFPSAEINIMGSYRRGNNSCGDVDIMIWHPEYRDSVPPGALGKIIDQLREKFLDDSCCTKIIEHHLTKIAGMNPSKYESLSNKTGRMLSNYKLDNIDEANQNDFCSSWMGVFNSPMVADKRRRVDIKWYPYKDRIFATLYFTGNAYFNRSMRLWAREQFKYKLSDHSLTDLKGNSVLESPSSEKDVFDILGLKWKEPYERLTFDDVQSVKESNSGIDRIGEDVLEADVKMS